MLYSLSTSVIMDTIQAMAAFQIMSASDERKSLLSPLLRSGSRGQLKPVVKNAFAETVLSILPYVKECSLDGETAGDDPGHQESSDESDLLLTLELSPLKTDRDHAGAALRRTIEHIVAMKSMKLWMLSAGDLDASRSYETLAETALTGLLAALRPAPRPHLRDNFRGA